ncbi:MAG TPA: hypothetical protein VHO69_14710 [Phototrophicaceae bacterium]|nr:hypothetical protein [Phototrophicaceae bacterium]
MATPFGTPGWIPVSGADTTSVTWFVALVLFFLALFIFLSVQKRRERGQGQARAGELGWHYMPTAPREKPGFRLLYAYSGCTQNVSWTYRVTETAKTQVVVRLHRSPRNRRSTDVRGVWFTKDAGSPDVVFIMPKLPDLVKNILANNLDFQTSDLARNMQRAYNGDDDLPMADGLKAVPALDFTGFEVYAASEAAAHNLLTDPARQALQTWATYFPGQAATYQPAFLFYPGGVLIALAQEESRIDRIEKLVAFGTALVNALK